MPEIISRAGWNARAPKQRLLMARSKGMFTHYTAGDRARNRNEGVARTAAVQGYHMNTRGWSDIAYSFLVDDDGTVYEGRGWGVIGGHTMGYNSTSHAVCAHLGEGQVPTSEMLDSVRWLHQEHDRRYGSGFHLPHRAVRSTACPGPYLAGFTDQGFPGAGGSPEPVHQGGTPVAVDWAAVRRFAAAVHLHNLQAVAPGTVYRHGDRAGGIKAVQDALNIIAGTKLTVDGHYGALTGNAIRNFQRFFGLQPDGVFGPKTHFVLMAVLVKITEGA